VLCFLLAGLVGCGSLNEDYVRAHREIHDGLAPCVSAGIAAVGTGSLRGRAWGLLYRAEEGMIRAAEEDLAAERGE
jgi:hypothetical protein